MDAAPKRDIPSAIGSGSFKPRTLLMRPKVVAMIKGFFKSSLKM